MAVLVFYGESLYFKDSQNKLTNETEATIRRLLLENNGVGILKIKKLSYPLCLLGRAVRRTTIMIVRRKGYDSLFFLPQSKHFVRKLGEHDGRKDEAAAENFSGAHRLTKNKPAADEREG